MEAAVIIGAVDAALTLIERLAPLIQAAATKGDITPEQQAALKVRIDNLRPGGTAFTGPEWQPSK